MEFKSTILAVCLTLFVATTFAADCSSTGCSGTNGTCYQGFTDVTQSYCACRSGYSGASCSTVIGSSCNVNFTHVNATTTSAVPLSIGVSFSSNTLNVAVASPLVTERNYTLIAIDDSAFANENCTYPGAHWTRSEDATNCDDVFTGAMPWVDNPSCGWSIDNTSPSLAVYSAQMVIEHHDFFDPFGNRSSSSFVERVTQHVVPLTISFPKNITVTSDITVQSPVRLLAAISKQSVTPDGTGATIEIATNLLWPYQLSSFTITSDPGTATTYTPTLVSTSCPNDGSSSCTQVFRIAIVTGSACTLNGQYNLQWSLTCQQTGGNNPPACAINAGAVATAVLDVISEDFCATVSTVTPLSGSLACFGDLAHSLTKAQFLVGQTLFFRATVISTNVTLSGTTINSVKLTSPGQPDVLLYSNLVLGSDGTDASFSAPTSSTNTADFQFTLTSGFIAGLADDSARTYTTRVIVDVDYLNVVTSKRTTESVEVISALTQQPVSLTNTFQSQKPAAGSAQSLSCGLTLAFSIAFYLSKLF